MKKIFTLCVLAFLAGCDAGPQQDNTTAPVVTAKYLYKNAVYFPDGEGLEFNGKLRRYDLISNDKGNFDRYTFEFSEDIMTIEGAVFATLAKRGYQRKVRREEDGLFVANYVKKAGVPVSMTFERVPAKESVQAFTRLRVNWKNN